MLTKGESENIARWLALAAVFVICAEPPRAMGQHPGVPAPASTASQDAVLSLIDRLVEKGILEDQDAKELSALAGEQDVVVSLINRLVKKGVLENQDAAELVASAKKDAEKRASEPAAPQAPELPAPVEGEVRVTYIPEVVRSQIRDEIRMEVMDQAREERWADPRQIPDWLTGLDLEADLRVRWEASLFPEGNAFSYFSFWDFNSINAGGPLRLTNDDGSRVIFDDVPYQNVDADRNRYRLRARFGLESDLGQDWTMGMAFATGSDNSPVSTNQTLGSSGGNFSKYQLWLDKAYLAYQFFGEHERDLKFITGRFDNPFFSTDMLWDSDIRFDGFALLGHYETGEAFTPFFTAGIFPVYNSAFNFATHSPSKFSSYNKYLYAIQGGVEVDMDKDIVAKFGVGYYHFDDIQGRKSSPFDARVDLAGDTDESRPSFAQSGNTYFPLRTTVDKVGDGLVPEEQYFGLATPFELLALTSRIDFNNFENVQVSLIGEYINNLGWDQSDIDTMTPFNNLGPGNVYAGGNTAFLTELVFGSPTFEETGDWRFGIGYRYVESDALVDAFTNSDFGGGGTNLEGFTVSGAIALEKKVTLGLSWMSADSIAGPRYSTDLFMLDLSQKF